MHKKDTRLQRNLHEYIEAIENLNRHDDWWSHFMKIMRCIPNLQSTHLKSAKHMHEGYEFTVLENLIFQYTKDLHKRWEDDSKQLRRFLGNLNAQHPQTAFTPVLTNGLAFHVYSPQTDQTGMITNLETVYGLNLSSPLMTPEQALSDLGNLFAHCGS